MTTLYIILFFLFIMILGARVLYLKHFRIQKKINFANEYRSTFIEFNNTFFQSASSGLFAKGGNIDNEKYVLLTMNSNKIQSQLGQIGVMQYIGPFQQYSISNYQIILNTLPKYRDGHITTFDVNAVDDALLRYLGTMEESRMETVKNISNPFVWLRQGFKEIFSLPIYIINWFGIIPDRTLGKITSNIFYKTIIGIISVVTFLSGIVTIIQGKDDTIKFFKHFFAK